jgi:putative transposase
MLPNCERWVSDYFRKPARRRVAKDRTITLNGKLYEAPVALIGKQAQLLYHENRPEQVEVLYNQKSYGFLTLLDLHVNARVKRDKNSGTEINLSDPSSKYQGGELWSNRRREP